MAQQMSVTPIVIQGGEVRQGLSSPFVGSFPGKGMRRGLHLYLLAECAAASPEALCRRVLEGFQRSLEGQGNVALTTALNRAYQNCHRDLCAVLEKEPVAARVGVGLTALVLRDGELTFARGGPGVIYLREARGVRKLEPQIVTPTPASEGEPQLLGITTGEVSVSLGRHAFQAGQALLAATSTLSRAVTYDGLDAILAASPEQAARQLHLLMREESYFAALLVAAAS